MLAALIKRLGRLEDEIVVLDAASVTMNTRELHHRGRALRRREIPALLASLRREAASLRADIAAKERLRRSVHRAAASALGLGWAEHLDGLVHALHYAEHSLLALRHAYAVYQETFSKMTSGSRISDAGIAAVMADGAALQRVMALIYSQRESVRLDAGVTKRLGKDSWTGALEEFKLQTPSRAMIQSWVEVVEGWVFSQTQSLEYLRRAVLDQLLATEALVSHHYRGGTPIEPAPGVSVCPE